MRPGDERGHALLFAAKQPGGSKAANQANGAVINAEELPVVSQTDIIHPDRFFMLDVYHLFVQHFAGKVDFLSRRRLGLCGKLLLRNQQT